MTDGPTLPLETYQRLVAEAGGGYLRNAIHEAGVTCETCTTPVNPGYPECIPCERRRLAASAQGHQLATLVLPLVYAETHTQAARLMYGYKDVTANARLQRRLTLLLALALTLHRGCIDAQVGQPAEIWTFIPSTTGKRSGPHPLQTVARKAEPAPIELTLGLSDLALGPRDYSPARWVIEHPDLIRDRHVLVIDDTWTTGAKVQSAASALRAAGALAVTVMVIARWLDPRYGNTASFVAERVEPDYDPARCPLTGLRH